MENNQEIIRLENVSKTFDLRYHKPFVRLIM